MSEGIIILIIGGMLLYIMANIIQLKDDVGRTQRTLNKIVEHLNIPDNIDEELKKLILNGKEIQAVKKYRYETGASLVEAKKYIDTLKEN